MNYKNEKNLFFQFHFSILQLEIRAIEAQNVPNNSFESAPDSYLVAQLSNGSMYQRTRVIDNSSNPVWNHKFRFKIPVHQEDVIRFVLRNRNVLGEDQNLTKLEIQLKTIDPDKLIDNWFNMIPCQGISSGCNIHFLIKLLPIKERYQSIDPSINSQSFYQPPNIPSQNIYFSQNMMIPNQSSYQQMGPFSQQPLPMRQSHMMFPIQNPIPYQIPSLNRISNNMTNSLNQQNSINPQINNPYQQQQWIHYQQRYK